MWRTLERAAAAFVLLLGWGRIESRRCTRAHTTKPKRRLGVVRSTIPACFLAAAGQPANGSILVRRHAKLRLFSSAGRRPRLTCTGRRRARQGRLSRQRTLRNLPPHYGSGSRTGPDLTDIGGIRKPEQLEKSLLDPDADIVPQNRSYRVVTRAGETITGRLLNLDAFSVQLLDTQERLRSFAKSNLKEWPSSTNRPCLPTRTN